MAGSTKAQLTDGSEKGSHLQEIIEILMLRFAEGNPASDRFRTSPAIIRFIRGIWRSFAHFTAE